MSIDVTYYSFSTKRADEAWNDKRGEAEIKKLADVYNKYSDTEFNSPEMVEELTVEFKSIDLELGGVRNLEIPGALIIEDTSSLIFFTTALHRVYGFEREDEEITRDNLIYIFKNLSTEKVEAAAEIAADEGGFEYEEAKELTLSFLNEMRPVAKDLIDTEDVVFYVDYHGSDDGEPKEVEDMLNERARMLVEKYKEKLTSSS